MSLSQFSPGAQMDVPSRSRRTTARYRARPALLAGLGLLALLLAPGAARARVPSSGKNTYDDALTYYGRFNTWPQDLAQIESMFGRLLGQLDGKMDRAAVQSLWQAGQVTPKGPTPALMNEFGRSTRAEATESWDLVRGAQGIAVKWAEDPVTLTHQGQTVTATKHSVSGRQAPTFIHTTPGAKGSLPYSVPVPHSGTPSTHTVSGTDTQHHHFSYLALKTPEEMIRQQVQRWGNEPDPLTGNSAVSTQRCLEENTGSGRMCLTMWQVAPRLQLSGQEIRFLSQLLVPYRRHNAFYPDEDFRSYAPEAIGKLQSLDLRTLLAQVRRLRVTVDPAQGRQRLVDITSTADGYRATITATQKIAAVPARKPLPAERALLQELPTALRAQLGEGNPFTLVETHAVVRAGKASPTREVTLTLEFASTRRPRPSEKLPLHLARQDRPQQFTVSRAQLGQIRALYRARRNGAAASR